jgi:hypothetical protein
VPQYAQLAMQEQVALVEVPPYGDSHASANSALHLARLSDDRDWFIQTPVETQLADGLVIAVKDHGN